MSVIYPYFFAVAPWATALVSLLLVFLWIRYYRGTRKTPPVLAALTTPDGISIPVTAKENLIGRGKAADLLLPVHGVAKRHALLYVEHNRWMLAPAEGKVAVNLQNLSRPAPLEYGDKITIAGQTLAFRKRSDEDISSRRPKGAALPLFVLTVFQLLVFSEIALRYFEELNPLIPAAFLGMIAAEWCYFGIGRMIRGFEMLAELPVLYLSTLGLAVCCSAAADQLAKQMVCYAVGFVLFLLFTLALKHREMLVRLQRPVMLLSLALLYFTAFFGTTVNSSRNWLQLGGFSFQPSELIKAAFVLAGAATLYIIIIKPARQWEFLIYSVLCMGALAIMLDFGAVAIFFVGMMVILTLRLVHPLVLGGIVAAAGAGGCAVIFLYPYIARRFGVWLHAWQYADSTGYQQTRTMMASASGGLLGVGGGNGYLTGIPAAETDLVFGVVSEEWGGIVALCAALCLAALGLYAYRLIKNADSLFDSIAVGAAAVMLIFQSALNIFGSLDLLPLTGVTLVFVSRGGTSLIAAWLMIAFFKAAELHHSPIRDWGCEE